MKLTSPKQETPFKLFLIGVFFVFSPLSSANSKETKFSCKDLEPWVQAQNLNNKGTVTLLERNKLHEAEMVARKSVSKIIFKKYIAKQFSMDKLRPCLEANQERQNFLNTLHSEFLNGSIQVLKTASSSSIQRFLKALDQKLAGQQMLFRLLGHYENVDNLQAGFHRGSGSIFMNLNVIPPNDWLIILVHELIHALDGNLKKGMEVYANSQWVSEFAKYSQKSSDINTWPSSVRENLNIWLEGALDRGLFGEYRAWAITSVLYREGLKENLWSSIPWLEEIAQSGSFLNLVDLKKIYLFLDQRFNDPVDGVFSHAAIQNELQKMRQRYRHGAPPELGEFMSIIQ